MLTMDEAAERIGISRSSVERLVGEGALASSVTGDGERRLESSEVDAFALSRARMQDGLNDAATEARATGLFTRRPAP